MFDDIKKELEDVYKYRYVVYSFVQTNLKLRYRRSYLGFIWTILAPMLNYLVMGVIFSFIMANRMPNYFVYYFSGAIFFAIVSSTLNRAPTFLIGNEHYIKKIYVPKLIFILNGTIYEITNFLLSAISLIVLGMIFGKLDLSWHSFLIFIPIVLISFFLIGIGTLIGIATVYFRDLMHIVPVVVQAAFFLTPVIYEKSMIPQKFQFLVELNPLYYFLELYRLPLVYHEIPPLNYFVICFILASVTFSIGLFMIKKFDNRIIFKL